MSVPAADRWVVQGREVTLPVEVRVARAAVQTFVVRPGPARDLVTPAGLEPVTVFGRRSLAVLAWQDYDDTDLDAYHEVALAIPVLDPEGGDRGGAYIHQLPVDQGFTLEVGRDVWGFPKYLADISLDVSDSGATGSLSVDGAHVLSFRQGRRVLPLPSRETTMHAYSWCDGTLRRTPFTSRSSGVRAGPGGGPLRVGRGHRFADDLLALGLDRRRPIASTVVLELRAEFGAAEVVSSS